MGSRTVMFSHHTGLCYVAKPCIHLQAGDPHMIVQVITEQYPTAAPSGVSSTGGGGGWHSSLKVVDVVCRSENARARVAIMQSIERRWLAAAAAGAAKSASSDCSENGSNSSSSSSSRGMMWCGDVGRDEVTQMLHLRATLHHTMECAVVLTDDPYLQVHIPIKDCENQLSCMMVTARVPQPLGQASRCPAGVLDRRRGPPPGSLVLPPPPPPAAAAFQGDLQTRAAGTAGFLLLWTGGERGESNEVLLLGDGGASDTISERRGRVACTHREHTLLPYSNCLGGGTNGGDALSSAGRGQNLL